MKNSDGLPNGWRIAKLCMTIWNNSRSTNLAKYGLKGEEPTEIAGAALEYFNQKIRPELDRQHERMMKGRDI